jgi:hypothetical protein
MLSPPEKPGRPTLSNEPLAILNVELRCSVREPYALCIRQAGKDRHLFQSISFNHRVTSFSLLFQKAPTTASC